MTESDSHQQNQNEWLRLSPVSVVFYMLQIVKMSVSHFLPSLAPLAVVILNADDKVTIIALITMAMLTLLVGGSILQYLFFKYRLDKDQILVNSGVFKRQHRVISFDRVQNININQPIYFRPFELVTLVVETAGAKGGEGDLAGIPSSIANNIRDQVLQRQSELKANQQEIVEDQITQTQEQTIATASTGDIARYGMSNNGMFLILAFLSPFLSKIDKFFEQLFTQAQLNQFIDMLGGKLIGGIIFVIGIVVLIFTSLIVLSIIGSILKFHRYQLTLNDGTLKRKSGLINTHEESLNLSKIQAIVRRCNFVGRWLKRENLICRQTTSGDNKQQTKASLFIVPARTKTQSDQLTSMLYPDYTDDIQSHAISRRYIIKTFLVYALLPVILLSAIVIFNEGAAYMAMWLFALPLYPLVVRRWSQYRYAISEDYGLIHNGFIGYNKVIFPLFKVQRAVISQSPVQKRRQLATLTIYLASGRLSIPYMPIAHAQQWFDRIYYKVETDSRPWF
jgi:putative membrane protein